MSKLTAIDLFCGCGGVSSGFMKAGFRVLAAMDNNKDACATFSANHPSVLLIEDDIRTQHAKDQLIRGLDEDDVNVVTICAPCQPFSSLNRSGVVDEEKRLLIDAIDVVARVSPDFVFIENVPGLVRDEFAGLRNESVQKLRNIGYNVGEVSQVNMADFRVPQKRVRSVLFAATKEFKLPCLDQPITPVGNRRTVRDGIGNLVSLASGEEHPSDPLHRARNHHPQTLERLKHIPKDGGSRDALPDHLILDCHRGHSGHPDVYGRMAWNEEAPTLTTGCTDLTKGRFAHPRDDRAITAREAARLQGFDDDYEFVGSLRSISRQIGNAVPVPFSEVVAQRIRGVQG